MTDDAPRWLYRFDNYRRAFSLLREAIELTEEKEPTQLEKEGTSSDLNTPPNSPGRS